MKDDKYIERILKYIRKINTYMENIGDVDEFSSQEMIIDAVLLNLEQIGETVRKISTRYKQDHVEIDWINIAGLRNLISHEYEEVNVSLIFFIVTDKINSLLDQLTVSSDS